MLLTKQILQNALNKQAPKVILRKFFGSTSSGSCKGFNTPIRLYSNTSNVDAPIDYQEELNSDYYVPKKLYDETVEKNSLLLKEIGKLEAQLETREEIIWRATTRSAMDNFEKLYGSEAEIDRSKIPKDISFDERTRQVRKQRMEWILKKRANERKVARLIKEIEKSCFSSSGDFADAYATAYFELSEELKKRLLYPGVGEFDFKGLTTDPDSNIALRVFMHLFEFPKEVVIRKEIPKKS